MIAGLTGTRQKRYFANRSYLPRRTLHQVRPFSLTKPAAGIWDGTALPTPIRRFSRSMNIPALIGISVEEWDGETATSTSYRLLYIDPDEETSRCCTKSRRKRIRHALRRKSGAGTITRNGKKIHLYANIRKLQETWQMYLQTTRRGSGLFGQIFVSRVRPLSHGTGTVSGLSDGLRNHGGKKSDYPDPGHRSRQTGGLLQSRERRKSAMGYRAIRICLDRRDIFGTQLRAILRASVYGTLAIMFR